MTETENRVLEMIQNTTDKTKAFDVAVKVILDYLSRTEEVDVKAD